MPLTMNDTSLVKNVNVAKIVLEFVHLLSSLLTAKAAQKYHTLDNTSDNNLET